MKPLLTASFLVAFAAFITPWAGRFFSSPIVDSAIYASVIMTVVWFTLLIPILLRFRKQGLWALIGLPFVLYWP